VRLQIEPVAQFFDEFGIAQSPRKSKNMVELSQRFGSGCASGGELRLHSVRLRPHADCRHDVALAQREAAGVEDAVPLREGQQQLAHLRRRTRVGK